MRTYIPCFTDRLLSGKSPCYREDILKSQNNTSKLFCSLIIFFLTGFSAMHTNAAGVTYTWTGASNASWTDSTNWSPVSMAGGPNGCDVDVVIPATSISPFVTASITAGNVTIKDDALLVLKASIIICKNLTGGTSAYATVSGPGVVIFTSANAQTITGKIQMSELYLDNVSGLSMQPGAVLDIYNALDLKAGNFDVTAGTLTLKSNNTDSAAVLDNFSAGNRTGTITGKITVERYYNASSTYDQHFIGSPISNVQVSQLGASGTAGFVQNTNCDETHSSSTSPYGTLFSLQESNGAACALQQWEVVTTGTAQNMAGYSFLSHGAGKLALTGFVNVDTAYSLSGLTNSGWSNTSMQGHTYHSGWQLVSNPYMAPLELTENSAGFDNQIQVWNCDGPYAGSYQPGFIGTDAFVAPFQAFMVHKTNVGGTATYTINGNQRVRLSHTFYQQNGNQLVVTAINTNTGLKDKTTIAFNIAANDAFDPQYDAVKFPGRLNRHTIYTVTNGEWMSVNVLHNVNVINTVAMGFEPGATGSYTLNFEGLNTFAQSATIYLEDKATHVMFNIATGSYTFNADSADSRDRFVLHFTPGVQVNVTNAACSDSGTVTINQPGSTTWSYILADSNKTTVSSGVLGGGQGTTVTLAAGAYTLTLTDSTDRTVTQTVVITGASIPAPLAGFQLTTGTSLVSITQAQIGERITATATIGGQASYLWMFGNGTIDSDGVTSTAYKTAGQYQVSLFVENAAGCTATQSQMITITDAPTAIQIVTGNDGPAIWSDKNVVYVDFRNAANTNATINIYDLLGRQVSSERSEQLLYQKQIDDISAGYFIVAVNNDQKTITKKVFIGNIR